ncbi:hypothetical protein [Lysobacter tyrosinilyticus]
MNQSGYIPLRLGKLRFLGLSAWAALVLLQSLIWPSDENFVLSACILAGGVVGTSYALRRPLLLAAPISTCMVLGFTSYHFLLPPLAQLLEGHSVATNLERPVSVGVHTLIGLFAIVIAHLLYRQFPPLQGLRWILSERVYRPFGYFRVPTNLQLFFMGGIGLAAMAFQIFVAGAGQTDVQGAGNKAMQALYPLAYLPFCILVPVLFGKEQVVERRWLPWLAAYAGLLLLISMGRNSRGVLLVGVASIVLAYGYAVAVGLVSTRLFKSKQFWVALVVSIVLLGPVADLATAMVIVRGERSSTSAVDLVGETLDTYADPTALADYRAGSAEQDRGGWDEHYVDNLFLARLANLKFIDNSLVLASRLNGASTKYLRYLELQKVLAVFPRPVLDAFAPWVDKDLVSGSSGGDLMAYTITHNKYMLGGFRTGSLLGSAYGQFGWWYPLMLVLPLLLTYSIADAQTTGKRSVGAITPVMAPITVITLFSWVHYLTSAATGIESYSGLSTLILRGWLQSMLVYAVALWVSRLAIRIKVG